MNANTGVIAGSIDFAAAEVSGGVYTVTATATDTHGASAGQTFAWTVTNTPRLPISLNDSAQTNAGTPVTIDVLANDSDPQGLSIQLVAAPAVSTNGGSVTANTDGTLTYQPPVGFAGTDTLGYTVRNSALRVETWGKLGGPVRHS